MSTKYFKLLNKDLTHFGYVYKPNQLNEDPNWSCMAGGLHFFSEDQLRECFIYFCHSNLHYIAEVTLPEDAQVLHEEGMSNADKFYLGPLKEFWSDFELCKLAINQKIKTFHKVSADNLTENQYFELCKMVVERDGKMIDYIRNLSNDQYFEVCKIALNQNDNSMGVIFGSFLSNSQYFEVCKIAVLQNGYVLYDVTTSHLTTEQYLEICEMAIDQNPIALGSVEVEDISVEDYFELCKSAIRINYNCLKYISGCSLPNDLYFEICMFAVGYQHKDALEYVLPEYLHDDQYDQLQKII